MAAEKFNFNKGLVKLEEIISKMESGDLSLEESLKYFEEGVKIHRQCHTALTDAEHRISVLSESDNYNKEKSFEDS
ncbi:exodeoxyribonuclease VII small subunit [Candidatus Pseudothioglobus singularis]|nr:exodeoxyribonuclease VII small subunit [Candidatus Pseudothioglobus singularis]